MHMYMELQNEQAQKSPENSPPFGGQINLHELESLPVEREYVFSTSEKLRISECHGMLNILLGW